MFKTAAGTNRLAPPLDPPGRLERPSPAPKAAVLPVTPRGIVWLPGEGSNPRLLVQGQASYR